MPDREMVVAALECLADGRVCADCGYKPYDDCNRQVARDALAMLKEQPDVVLCKDCKHYKDGFCYNPNTYDDGKTKGNTVPDWFCADGERTE